MSWGRWGASRLSAVALLACVGPADVEPTDPVADSPEPVDSLSVDSDPVDSEPSETELGSESEPPDSEPVDSESTDSEPSDSAPVDSEPPAPVGPAWGPGFVELSSALWAGAGFAPAFNGGPLPELQGALFGDLDGDGLSELYVQNLVPVGSPDAAPRGEAFQFDPATRAFTHDPALSAALRSVVSSPVIALLDLDGDGHDDLLRAGTIGAFGFGDGAGAFQLRSAQVPFGVTLPGGLYTATLGDIDEDGWLDVLFGTDPCTASGSRPTVLPMLRTAERTWTLSTTMLPEDPIGDADALMLAPLGGEPLLLMMGLACTFPSTHPGFYQRGAYGGDGRRAWTPVDAMPPDALSRFSTVGPAGYLTQLNPMGGAVVDLNGDGLLDFVVTVADDLNYLYHGRPTLPLYEASLDTPVRNRLGVAGYEELPWSVAPVDLDLDGRADLVISHGDDARLAIPGESNYPHSNTAHWQDTTGQFVEVSAAVHTDVIGGNYRSLYVGDLDGDLDEDLAFGGYGDLPLVLVNDIETANHRLSLRLRGTSSNHLGLGAIVRVEADGLAPQTRLMGETGAPGVVNPAVLRFGLGAASEAARVEVTWPSGVVQVVEQLAAGVVHVIEEPALFEITPASRHLPADGVSRFVVRVSPRNPDGTLRAGAQVGIERLFGAGSFAGPVVADAAGWSRELIVGTQQTSIVFEITVDGVVMPLRPRVWLDPAP